MDWQHLIMNGENLAEYAALLARRGPARPPARELRLGHLRRRQHGRRDRVHGDARARGRAAPRRATATTASGSGSTSTRTPRTRSTRCGARCSSGGSSTAVAARIDERRAARGAGREGRRARVRARLRRARRVSGLERRREAAARLDRDPARRGGAGAGVLRRRCSASRSATCCRSSTRRGSSGTASAATCELHLMLARRARRADKPHFCLVVDDLDGAAARGSRRRASRRATGTELVGRPRFTCRDPFGNLIELARIES